MKNNEIKRWYGIELTKEEIEIGRVSYKHLADAIGSCILNNYIKHFIEECGGEWDLECGELEYYETKSGEQLTQEERDQMVDDLNELKEKIEEMTENNEDAINDIDEQIDALTYPIEREIYQWFLIDGSAVELLRDAGELVLYNENIDQYIWGVTHYGTSWNIIYTDLEIE